MRRLVGGAGATGARKNRWYAAPEPVVSVAAGEEIALELVDGFDGQLTAASTHCDVAALDVWRSHPLTGPVYIEGADPGDVLDVEFLAFEMAEFGATPLIPGVGLLADAFPEPYLVTWEIDGSHARSPALPGVAVPGAAFAGVVGVAPSERLLRDWIRRERAIAEIGGNSFPPVPQPGGTAAEDGVVTVPPRETGGNLDIPQLTAGSHLYLEVVEPGALVSLGDMHFAQGEGEACGTAIEVAGTAIVRFSVLRRPAWPFRAPVFRTPPRPSRAAVATTGLPLRGDGRNEVLDLTLAARNALLGMIEYLVETRAIEREAAYALTGVAVDLRIGQAVNRPNCLVSALLPLDVFEDGTELRPGEVVAGLPRVR